MVTSASDSVPVAQVGSYKGHPTISLPLESGQPFSFGVKKAETIVAHLETVRGFVAGEQVNSGARVEDYKGQPILILPMGEDRDFRFGRAKAEAVLRHEDAIRHFVAGIETAPVDAPPPDECGTAESQSEPPTRPGRNQVTENARRAAAFRKLAEGMQRQIDEKRRPAFEGQRSTARRERFRASKAEDARHLERLQDKLNALADAWEGGAIPDRLRGVRTKAQVEYLLTHPHAPRASITEDWLKKLLDHSKGKRGVGKARDLLSRSLYVRREGPDRHLVPLYGLEDVQAVETLLKAVPQFTEARWIKESLAGYLAVHRAGITTLHAYMEARDALARMGDPEAGQKTQADLVADAERELVGLKIPGFFPTPAPVVQMMIARAGLEDGQRVLEPSAGKGNIADGVRAACPGAVIEVCEVQYRLRAILTLKGYTLVGEDFLELSPVEHAYDRILMNPPFEHFQDVRHVNHAYRCLKPGGRLVAVMCESVFFRRDRVAAEFRDWLEAVGGWDEKLPEGAFKESGTGVAARLVVIDRGE